MTDKHIPASKLEALLSDADVAENYDNSSYVVSAKSLRALIDEAPEVEKQDDEAVAYGIPHDENNNTFAYELLAMELAAEEHDDIHQLVYEGYPPEPWGEVWQRYEADAKKMIERVQKYTRPSPNTYTEHDIDVAIGVVEWDKLNLFATAEMVKQIVMRFVGSQVTGETDPSKRCLGCLHNFHADQPPCDNNHVAEGCELFTGEPDDIA